MVDTADSTAAAISAWRARVGLSQRAAAQALQLGLKAYQELERGASYQTGAPRAASRRTLLACAALEAGLEPIASPLAAPVAPAPRRSNAH